MKLTQGGRLSAAAVGLILATSPGSRATAQVLDIGQDGTVAVIDTPAVYEDPAAPPSPLLALPARPRDERRKSATGSAAIASAAASHNLSARVVEAVAWRESRLDPRALSPKGAVGEMQLMPGTAREMGVDLHDPAANLDGGAAYLARMMDAFDGDVTLALAAYNAGPAAVKRHAGVPPYPETRAFVAAVMDRLANDVSRGGAR